MGPEGGDGGGEIIAVGPPETVAKEKRSYTGEFLRPVLARARAARRGGDVGVEAAE
jgi:excinuclease ABC subunit A